MPNYSVQRFQAVLALLPQAAKTELLTGLREEARTVAGKIKQNARQGKTGRLKESVRIEYDAKDLSVKIKAGGPLTTVQARSGIGVVGRLSAALRGRSTSFDYALANEFGTSKESGNKFFYGTWRAERKKARRKISGRIRKVIRRTYGGS